MTRLHGRVKARNHNERTGKVIRLRQNRWLFRNERSPSRAPTPAVPRSGRRCHRHPGSQGRQSFRCCAVAIFRGARLRARFLHYKESRQFTGHSDRVLLQEDSRTPVAAPIAKAISVHVSNSISIRCERPWHTAFPVHRPYTSPKSNLPGQEAHADGIGRVGGARKIDVPKFPVELHNECACIAIVGRAVWLSADAC